MLNNYQKPLFYYYYYYYNSNCNAMSIFLLLGCLTEP